MKAAGLRFAVAGALLAAALSAGKALANDSTASLDTGDLVLVPNPDIRMLEEDLFVSRTQIRVRYLFENTSAKDIATEVAFPVPPVDFSEDVAYAVDSSDPVDFVGFKVWIDGRTVMPSIEAKASVQGQDVTQVLEKYGIPLTTFTPDSDAFDALRARLDALPEDAKRDLRSRGLISPHEDGFSEYWTTSVTYHWPMVFPTGRHVEVRHAYTPVPQSTFYSEYDIKERTFHDAACIDDAFERAALRQIGKAGAGAMSATIVRYILTTANNWRGSIGRFRLTVDKGEPDVLVSFCGNGVTRTGPTTFVMEARDFVPDRDLTVLFLQKMDGAQ